jgi:D-alanyl-D-alanine carboxypeptidase
MSERIIGLKKEESGNQNKVLYDELFVKDSGYRLVSSTPKVFSAIHPDDFGENFYISEEELDFYIEGFISAVSENVDDISQNIVKEESNNNDLESGLDDLDTKLSLYRSFRSLYDKWIASSNIDGETSSGYFFNNYGQSEVNGEDDKRLLFEHFSFVNRTNSNIGNRAVIDFSYLSNLANSKNGQGPTQSLYESITNLLTENKFEFFAMPSLIGYSDSDSKDLIDIFRTIDGPINRIPAKPGFICMFIGGNSRTLDIPQSYCGINRVGFDFVNDSFDIDDPTTYPQDFTDNGGITAFKVKYGQQTQNHFKSIELDQSEFKETQESLIVIDSLTNPSSGSDPVKIGKGNNVYDVNLTRGYSCTVTMLGDMQIQPMMIFKLENVPMFRGTYLITSVSHNIKPHNVETTFKGVRQPIVTVPIVTEALSLLDLALAEVVQGDQALQSNNGTISSQSLFGDVGSSDVTPPEIDLTVYGDNSDKTCPKDPLISDGGVGDAYIKGKLYKIRLCKVKGTDGNTAKVNVEMALNLANMIRKAQQDGVKLTLGSNFRTMQSQVNTARSNGCYKSGNFNRSDCNVATAQPGYSNHQSGSAIDFGCNGKTICYSNSSAWCEKNGSQLRPNEYPCFEWMVRNANSYGFYNYKKEAWHWSINGA